MLKQSHEVMEKAAALAQAIKSENWDEAERILTELQSTLDLLGNQIGDNLRTNADAPRNQPLNSPPGRQ
jgi:flagellin-specific chaperone FliS